MIDLVLILAIKLALYLSARAALPFLFGQARHASLDVSAKSVTSLPTPATARASTNSATFHSDSIHDDEDDDYRLGSSATDRSPFLAINKGSMLPSWPQLKASMLTPVRIRNSQGSLDLASVSALLFSLAFAEAASLFVAVLLETAGFPAGNGTTLRQVWRFDLAAVQALAIVLIPLAVCLLFTYRSNTSTPLPRRITYLLLPFVPWLVLFFKVPLPSALLDKRSGAGILDGLMARTAVIGVSFIAILSGSAALQAAWEAVEHFQGKQQRPPSQSDIRLAQESFQRTCSDLALRKTDLARLEGETPDRSSTNWSVSSLWGGDSRSRDIKSLKSEIFGLSSIATAMRDDLDRMTSLQHKDKLNSTIIGKVWILVGWVWAAYCAFRIALSLLNLLVLGYKDTAPPDFISLSVAYIIRIFDVDLDVAAWTKQVSLLFVGVLIWGRIGNVLSYLGSAFRAAGTGVSSSFLVLFLAEIMTIYLLATLIQLRSSLPAPVSVPPSPRALADESSPPLLATLPSFQIVFGSLFDSAFLLAAAATAVWKYLMYMQRTSSGDGGVLFGGAGR
ncbi:G protein-coupled receptor [Pseudozyma hubeiensis SY62]|uniref:G protein-coupled receptor n=1 Tax=Pseudozyma hubeiensis (strain SY62) TaxID=1305764 RepID=R9P1I0_PSEHS|nr:G protein-coupled receptor [Pseudozyma hubeiensis SY62]GAC94982.1 G protein-coupled receptor [Pseudozyma hubeiensis SY62]